MEGHAGMAKLADAPAAPPPLHACFLYTRPFLPHPATWCRLACSSLTPGVKCARTTQLLGALCHASLRPPCLDR